MNEAKVKVVKRGSEYGLEWTVDGEPDFPYLYPTEEAAKVSADKFSRLYEMAESIA